MKALLAENRTTRASLVDVEPVVLETVSGPEL